MPSVHEDVPLRWLRALSGSTKRVNGSCVASDEHGTLYPHKKDACATCEMFHADLRSEKQALKRHMQQHDQESPVRRDAIRGSRATTEVLEGALQKPKKEAAAAIQYHKQCVAGASTGYEKLVTMTSCDFLAV